MPFIGLIGCDGCGKSAVIGCVAEVLRAEGIKVACGHWRPTLSARQSTTTESIIVTDPHGQPTRGLAASVIKLGWLWLNWWVGWWTGLRKASREGVVLFDRLHVDLLADPQRYRYGGPLWLAIMATRIMPQPDMILFLDAAPDVLLSRKQEVSSATLAESRQRYLGLGDRFQNFQLIDVNQSLGEVVEEVLARIRGIH